MRNNDHLLRLMIITVSAILAIATLAKPNDLHFNICEGGCNFYFPWKQSK
jgi:hypothetical protein